MNERIPLNKNLGSVGAALDVAGPVKIKITEQKDTTPALVITNTVGKDGKESTTVERPSQTVLALPEVKQEDIVVLRQCLESRIRAMSVLPEEVREKEFAKLAKGTSGAIVGVETIDQLRAFLGTCEKVLYVHDNPRSGITTYEVEVPEGMKATTEWAMLSMLAKDGLLDKVKTGYSESLQRAYFNAPEVPQQPINRVCFVCKSGKVINWHAGFDLHVYDRQWIKHKGTDKVKAAMIWVHVSGTYIPQPRKQFEHRGRRPHHRGNNGPKANATSPTYPPPAQVEEGRDEPGNQE